MAWAEAEIFRIYSPVECGEDGYPFVWHRNVGGVLDGLIERLADEGCEPARVNLGVKHIVRARADHRCIRCAHPFIVGVSGEFEGPDYGARALAAELGLDLEDADQLFIDADMVPKGGRVAIAKRQNWSDCDDDCRHGGPARYLKDSGVWSPEAMPTADALHMLTFTRPVQALWRVLTVHHLNECKPDLRWWNLAALCQRCHLEIQGKVVMDRPWPWPHSEWFEEYVAAFYALKYLGEEIDRDEAVERKKELLALGAREEAVERMPL